MKLSARRVLTENDLGITKSHQAGFLIPKSLVASGLFDRLSDEVLNPRIELEFFRIDDETGFLLNYIYYNNKLFGGTRNEYRLTGLASMLRDFHLKLGDALVFTRTGSRTYSVEVERRARSPKILTTESWHQIYESDGKS